MNANTEPSGRNAPGKRPASESSPTIHSLHVCKEVSVVDVGAHECAVVSLSDCLTLRLEKLRFGATAATNDGEKTERGERNDPRSYDEIGLLNSTHARRQNV